jgi:DNA-binding Xre family transcriptional regulator
MQDYVSKLKKILDDRGVSLKALSEGINVPYRTLQDNLSKNKGLSVENLAKACTFLRISMDDLLNVDTSSTRQRESIDAEETAPYIRQVAQLMKDMDEDTQKDICLSVEKEKLLRDLLQQRENKKAG